VVVDVLAPVHAPALDAPAPVREVVAERKSGMQNLKGTIQNFIASLRSNSLPKRNTESVVLSSPVGLYHYLREWNGERSRVHLRIDPDGNGILLVNANRILHLNQSAVYMAYLILEGVSDAQATRMLTRAYQVSTEQAGNDYSQIKLQLNELIRPEGACPIHELDIDTILPFSSRPSAPYRMDLALTYRCNNECGHCYNARERTFPEMPTDTWKRILDRLWELGIPHVVFTGGEPTLRQDLPELVAYASQIGQITGLNTNGRRLSDLTYLQRLVKAGLDHIQITVESHDPSIHDRMVLSRRAWMQTIAGLQNALDTPLYVMTNTTMLQDNSSSLSDTLDFLAATGVPTVGLNALIHSGRGKHVGTGLSEDELLPLLELARLKTEKHGQRLIWYTPTQYCHFDPVQLELGVKGCTAALFNMCVEPDGSVLPCQSYYRPLGNLLNDSWDSIWNHDLSVSLRQREDLPAKCDGCTLLEECGGGCPLKFNLEN
jgi:radical SAM protein with 4Fe4S-binding SPASM domain